MVHNQHRIGNFTSSEIYKLMTNGKAKGELGKPAHTYIQEKNIERRLGRALNDISTAKPLTWGKVLESVAFDLLGLEYTICSTDTILNPNNPNHAGSPDGVSEDSVIDLKCPFTVKSFAIFSECKTIEDVRDQHDDGEKYYWQLVANGILTNKKFAELIIYCPYKSELNKIREACEDFDGNPNKVAWIAFAEDDDLPYILDGGYYQNIHRIKFEIPESDKIALMERIETASKLLTER